MYLDFKSKLILWQGPSDPRTECCFKPSLASMLTHACWLNIYSKCLGKYLSEDRKWKSNPWASTLWRALRRSSAFCSLCCWPVIWTLQPLRDSSSSNPFSLPWTSLGLFQFVQLGSNDCCVWSTWLKFCGMSCQCVFFWHMEFYSDMCCQCQCQGSLEPRRCGNRIHQYDVILQGGGAAAPQHAADGASLFECHGCPISAGCAQQRLVSGGSVEEGDQRISPNRWDAEQVALGWGPHHGGAWSHHRDKRNKQGPDS